MESAGLEQRQSSPKVRGDCGLGFAKKKKRSDAVLETVQHTSAWRNTIWWTNMKALDMMVDQNDHTRWKHKWSWHNRGCVWDRFAPAWAGDEDSTEKRMRCSSRINMRDFVALTLTSVKHSIAHRSTIGTSTSRQGKRGVKRKVAARLTKQCRLEVKAPPRKCAEIARSQNMDQWKRVQRKD